MFITSWLPPPKFLAVFEDPGYSFLVLVWFCSSPLPPTDRQVEGDYWSVCLFLFLNPDVLIFLVPYVSCHSAGFEVNPCYSAYEDESQFLASWPDVCYECYEPPSSAGITGEISLFFNAPGSSIFRYCSLFFTNNQRLNHPKSPFNPHEITN